MSKSSSRFGYLNPFPDMPNIGSTLSGFLNANCAAPASNPVIGETTLTNTLDYPLNDSLKSIAFPTAFPATDYYLLAYEILSATVNGITYANRAARYFVSDVCIADKLQNGCKIEFSGSAESVTVKYVIAEVV